MNKLTVGALLAGMCCAGLVGCNNPLRTRDSDLGPAIAQERRREIPTFDMEAHRIEGVGVATASAPAAPPDPFAGLDKLEVTIDQVRAWTLANNLDLRVAMVNPTISRESVHEEGARWEAVFFSNLRTANLKQPTASTLIGGEVQTTDLDFGVRVPLRTGGEVTVRLPYNRTKTNNQFSTLNPSFTTDFELSITQPLLRNAGRRSNTHALRVAALNEGVAESRTKLEVIRQLAAADRAYWRLYASGRALDVAQRQYELASVQLEQARRQVRAGVLAEIEVVRAEEGVAQRLEAIITSQNDVLLQQREIKRLVNVPGLGLGSGVMLIPVSEPAPAPYEFEKGQIVQYAIANRMEMLELELQLAIDASTIAFERNRALPLFALDYTYRVNGLGSSFNNSLGVLDSVAFTDRIFGLRAEFPIGNEAAKARVGRAILQRLQRLSSKEARVLAITQESLDAIDNIQSGWQRILAAAQSSILAGRTLEAQQRQFNVGRSTSTIVLDTATRLADAQLAEIRAVTEYEIDKVDLAFATGTLLGADGVEWSPLDPRGPKKESAAPQPMASHQR